jgi:hypothetical protein
MAGREVDSAEAVAVLVGEIRRQAVVTSKRKTRIKRMGSFFTSALRSMF